MLKQPDYLGDVGRIPHLISVIVVGFFAFLFSFMTIVNAIGTVILTVTRQWDLLPFVGGSVVGMGLFALGFLWMFRRLRRGGKSSEGVSVFPLWFIQLVGVILLPASVLGSIEGLKNAQNLRALPLVMGPPLAMILVPWLVRRRARRSETQNEVSQRDLSFEKDHPFE